jgi:hypothetical protein
VNDLPRQKLREIVAQYGRAVYDNPAHCKGLLLDICGGAYKREVNVLIAVLEEHVVDELLHSSAGVPTELILARLTQRLCDNRSMEQEAARWGVESWALALGMRASPASTTATGRPQSAAGSSPPVLTPRPQETTSSPHLPAQTSSEPVAGRAVDYNQSQLFQGKAALSGSAAQAPVPVPKTDVAKANTAQQQRSSGRVKLVSGIIIFLLIILAGGIVRACSSTSVTPTSPAITPTSSVATSTSPAATPTLPVATPTPPVTGPPLLSVNPTRLGPNLACSPMSYGWICSVSLTFNPGHENLRWSANSNLPGVIFEPSSGTTSSAWLVTIKIPSSACKNNSSGIFVFEGPGNMVPVTWSCGS